MKQWKYKRLFEILPGSISWMIIFLPVLFSIFAPRVLAIYMIFFLSYWLVKTYLMSYRLIVGFRNYKRDIQMNWLDQLKDLPNKNWQDIYHLVIVPTYKEDISILESSIKSVINSNFAKEKIIYVLATEERDRERAEANAKILIDKYKGQLADVIAIMHPKDIPGEIIGKGPNITHAGR